MYSSFYLTVMTGAGKRHAIAQAGPEVFFPPLSSQALNTEGLNYIMKHKDFHYLVKKMEVIQALYQSIFFLR